MFISDLKWSACSMAKVMEIIAKETNGKSYHTEKYSFDTIGMPSIDYDDESNRVMKWKDPAETEEPKKAVDLRQMSKEISCQTPIITLFLDGSRHVYKVDDISYNKKVFPVIAGQIGIACCRRENKRMLKEMFYRRLVIALPKVSYHDGWGEEAYFGAKVAKINDSPELKKLGIEFDRILTYREADDKGKSKVEDSGIAAIQDYMMISEKQMVAELAKTGKLNQDNYLLKDGSLEYTEDVRNPKGSYSLEKIKHNYKWVIGVSKSFNPESLMDHKGKPNANYIADLPLFYRTPAALYENQEFLGDVKFAVWYVRIRDKKQTRTPFDGVVKVEKILMPEEEAKGLDSETIDLLSATIINERNPTCYGTDKRWANHLYPVYLTETFIKSRYMSTETFLHLF